jgi:hypothetical protein
MFKEVDTSKIPDFNSFTDFIDWYTFSDSFYLKWPKDKFLNLDFNGVSETIIFRHGRFQVELYVVTRGFRVPKHSHPGVDTFELVFQPITPGKFWDRPKTKEDIPGLIKPANTPHGGPDDNLGSLSNHGGYFFVILEHWVDDSIPMNFITMQYEGWSMNEKHEEFISMLKPDAKIIEKPFADTTRKWITLCH